MTYTELANIINEATAEQDKRIAELEATLGKEAVAKNAVKERDDYIAKLLAALCAVLDTHNKEAKALMSWENAKNNFSEDNYEASQYAKAAAAASEAERNARELLTLPMPDSADKEKEE